MPTPAGILAASATKLKSQLLSSSAPHLLSHKNSASFVKEHLEKSRLKGKSSEELRHLILTQKGHDHPPIAAQVLAARKDARSNDISAELMNNPKIGLSEKYIILDGLSHRGISKSAYESVLKAAQESPYNLFRAQARNALRLNDLDKKVLSELVRKEIKINGSKHFWLSTEDYSDLLSTGNAADRNTLLTVTRSGQVPLYNSLEALKSIKQKWVPQLALDLIGKNPPIDHVMAVAEVLKEYKDVRINDLLKHAALSLENEARRDGSGYNVAVGSCNLLTLSTEIGNEQVTTRCLALLKNSKLRSAKIQDFADVLCCTEWKLASELRNDNSRIAIAKIASSLEQLMPQNSNNKTVTRVKRELQEMALIATAASSGNWGSVDKLTPRNADLAVELAQRAKTPSAMRFLIKGMQSNVMQDDESERERVQMHARCADAILTIGTSTGDVSGLRAIANPIGSTNSALAKLTEGDSHGFVGRYLQGMESYKDYCGQHASFLDKVGSGFTNFFHGLDLDARLSIYRNGLLCGIKNPFRFSDQTLTELTNNRNENKADKRPLAVVVLPRADWNSAFCNTSEVDKLIKHGYRVMAYEVQSDKQFVEAIHNACTHQKFSMLLIGGHGDPGHVSFGTTDPRFATESENLVGASSASQLELTDTALLKNSNVSECALRDARIVLESCSTGKGRGQSENIANFVSRAFPDTYVFAPTEVSGLTRFNFDSRDQIIDVVYKDLSAAAGTATKGASTKKGPQNILYIARNGQAASGPTPVVPSKLNFIQQAGNLLRSSFIGITYSRMQ